MRKKRKGTNLLEAVRRNRIIFFIFWILVTVFIFTNSMQVAEVSSEKSGRIVSSIDKICAFFNINNIEDMTLYVRKGAHIFEFFLQSCMMGIFFALGEKKYTERITAVLFAGLMTACVDEFIQLFFEGRAGMIQDVFIDFIGTAAGALTGFFMWKFHKRINAKS